MITSQLISKSAGNIFKFPDRKEMCTRKSNMIITILSKFPEFCYFPFCFYPPFLVLVNFYVSLNYTQVLICMGLAYFSFSAMLKQNIIHKNKKVFWLWIFFGSNTWAWVWKLVCSNYLYVELSSFCTNPLRVYQIFSWASVYMGREISHTGWPGIVGVLAEYLWQGPWKNISREIRSCSPAGP